jgi:hypothetical protein
MGGAPSSVPRITRCGPSWRSWISPRCCSPRSVASSSNDCVRSTTGCGVRRGGHRGVYRRVRIIRRSHRPTTPRAASSGVRCVPCALPCFIGTASSACPSSTACCTSMATRSTDVIQPKRWPTPCVMKCSKDAPCARDGAGTQPTVPHRGRIAASRNSLRSIRSSCGPLTDGGRQRRAQAGKRMMASWSRVTTTRPSCTICTSRRTSSRPLRTRASTTRLRTSTAMPGGRMASKNW